MADGDKTTFGTIGAGTVETTTTSATPIITYRMEDNTSAFFIAHIIIQDKTTAANIQYIKSHALYQCASSTANNRGDAEPSAFSIDPQVLECTVTWTNSGQDVSLNAVAADTTTYRWVAEMEVVSMEVTI